MDKFDLIVIGGGPGGYVAAERAAEGGLKVCLFEKNELGGVCLNEGCVPTKTLLHSAKVLNYAQHGETYGVKAENVSIDHAAVIERKKKVVKTLVSGVAAKMKAGKIKVVKEAAAIREKTAEMGELQAKFNPHFLYNTLEVIRSHLQQKGDNDTAGMIVLMSRVFRSALNNSHFTTLRSECTFINSYLDIYRWRYANSFDVIYDMDTTLLNCGIIRNLLQPLIENYFVHGFSPDAPRNQLIISGQPDGTDHILLTVEDNGLGMSPERLHELNDQLIARDNEAEAGGYGLVNLNDRIRLFYGSDCGLTISSIPDHHTTITMRIRRMSLEKHEQWSKKLP